VYAGSCPAARGNLYGVGWQSYADILIGGEVGVARLDRGDLSLAGREENTDGSLGRGDFSFAAWAAICDVWGRVKRQCQALDILPRRILVSITFIMCRKYYKIA
jgi:hypothetical protein